MKGEAQDDALECRGRARCNPFGGPGTDTCRPLRGDGFNAADVASGSGVPLRRRGLTAANLTFEGTASELTAVTDAERPQPVVADRQL